MKHEKRIVTKAKRNPDDFIQLYDHYYPKLYAYILSRTRHKEQAEDIVATAFTKSLDNIQKFHWKSSATFGSWLFRIARNEMLDKAKKESRVNATETDQLEVLAGNTPDASASLLEQEIESEKLEKFQEVLRAMSNLTEIEQEVISLKYFSQMSYKEIAVIMNKKPNTLAVLLKRSLEKIRKNLNV